MKKISTALLSVSDKTGIVELARALSERGVRLLSTGGTAKLLREQGFAVTDVSEITGFPEMMDGRVKTLHPAVHGGILAIRDEAAHRQAMETHGIGGIDLVVVNLYPFEQTVAAGAGFAETIEQIDIGGPAMIRSAAKNHHDVAVLVDPEDYATLASELAQHDGATTPELRRRLAATAFARTARYDAAIAGWMEKEQGGFGPTYRLEATRVQDLRYGENPHQEAAFYRIGPSAGTLAGAVQLQGKELSYNNLNDTDAAMQLVADLGDARPAVAIIKHANPCGVARGDSLLEAYTRALACDPKSAFGGIIALSRAVDGATAGKIAELFAEVVVAPAFDPEAREILSAKKNLRLLETGPFALQPLPMLKTVSGGLLVQSPDAVVTESAPRPVTKRPPSEEEAADLAFAFTVAKHVKSNAIVLVKGERTHGIGAGQMSRVDSVHLACRKAEENGLGTAGTVLASDAFFPFDDNVLAAAEAGVTALIQPGGSVRDDEVIAAADRHDLAMVVTGIRHFRH